MRRPPRCFWARARGSSQGDHLDPINDQVELTGTQGVGLLMWLATRGALGDKVRKVHANYHIPISNTAAGTMVLENAA